LIEPLGFDLEEKKLRRAGLDYRDMARVAIHKNFQAFLNALVGHRILACTTKGGIHYDKVGYKEGDVLLFGSETAGLPLAVLESIPSDSRLRIPMCPDNRSLNLSNAVAIISYEAWRQNGYLGGS
jgi:tRNA (cytidine/uridine-2'-O-)-methyltransferase